MNDILLIQKDDNIIAIINVDEIEHIDLSSKYPLFCEDKNQFEDISLNKVNVLSLASSLKKQIKKESLYFIEKYFPNIKGVILHTSFEEISFLYSLEKIERVTINACVSNSFDFTKMSSLKSASISYQESLGSILNASQLEKLEIQGFHPHHSSYTFSQVTNLKELILVQSNIRELSGIAELSKIETIEISYNRNISSLASLSACKSLRRLQIQNCPKILNYDCLSNLENLEILILENQKKIRSLDFIKNIPQLKRIAIVGTSNVLDGKLKWILEHPNIELVCDVKKHYDIKWLNLGDEFTLVQKE